ncbi:MAG TPA: RDD family protein [Jatrophihabitans sp.]|jgi:uncharacterized RDD family membrane protein YckC|uniref:RDD family protein n=1 Tax=Jatrophihabitans sp. TaxID=1932789 RepID=UPI002DF79DED|nr:RDD family protein [Jatrophihabitans sp.]
MEPNAAALVSGEGVRLTLRSAGVGSRIIAALIDLAVQFGAFLVISTLDVVLVGQADLAAIQAVVITEVVLILAGYPIVMEWLTKGRTVGKISMGLRVVRDDGGPVGFRHALVRGLAGLLLEKPGVAFPLTTVAGLLTISLSSREKRIGDMMAGTVVLNERAAPQALGTPPAWVPVPLQPWVLSLEMHRLDDRLALSMRQFISRAHAMTPPARTALAEQLRHHVLAVTSPPPPPGAPTPVLLMSVLAERRRRSLATADHAPLFNTRSTPPPHFTAPPYAPAHYPPVGYAPPPADGQPDNPFARPS